MDTTLTLAELLERNVPIACADAVAIAQLLISDADIAGARAPYGPLSVENVALSIDGTVRCLHTAATPSLVEATLLLQTLVARTSDRVPGGLRYAIGRALLEVEAPPFDTTADFSAALGRFEQGSRSDCVRRLVLRASEPALAAVTAAPMDGVPSTDRRRHEPAPSELRRQLREADLRLFELRQKTTSNAGQTPRLRRLPRAPIAACMAAGMVLVAAGEFTALPQQRRPGTPRAPLASTPIQISPRPSLAAPAVVPVTNVASETDAPRAAEADIRPGPRASTRPVRRSALTPASASADTATRPGPLARAHDNGRDRDRGVIARVRFEWKNPFR